MTAAADRTLSLEETPVSWYEEVGLTSGLETHQQVLTRKKLFCRCPAGIYSTEWDAEILRHMRPTLSELGEYDGTALMEFRTRKQIVYRINKQTVCTYEFDDTPPFEINEDALDVAVEIALLLNLNIVSELHIARKQYLDGSIPTGFQRTTILGVDGWIPYRGRRIGIVQLGLEEDACREVSDIGHVRMYITDRLGMPLVETVTYPEMSTPRDVAGVAEVIRRLNRATGHVRTGPGATRQDVNVSVRGGRRCEIKGVPSIKRIPRLVHNEAVRQVGLLEIREELRRRGVAAERFTWKAVDVTERLSRTRFWPILQGLREGRKARAVLLRGFEGLLRHPIGPGKTFLQELSDRVRVVACIDLLPNVLTTDAPESNLAQDEWQAMRRSTGAAAGDAVVVVWGPEADLQTACEEIAGRAREACDGVPHETRQAMPDGTTGFERVLPGPDRMYPDTDLPPKPLEDRRVERIRKRLPEPPWTRKERYRAAGLPEQLAERLSISPRAFAAFDRLEHLVDGHPVFAASLLTERLRHYRRKGADLGRLDISFLERAFELLAEGRIVRDGVVRLVERRLANGSDLAADDVVRELDLAPVTAAEIERTIDEILASSDTRRCSSPEAARRFVMGRVMDRLRGRAQGAEVARRLDERGRTGAATWTRPSRDTGIPR